MLAILMPCGPACGTKQLKWPTVKDRRAQTQSKRSKDLLTLLLVQSRLTRNRFLHLYISRSGKSNVYLLRRTRKGPFNNQTLLPRLPRPALPREVVSQMRLDMEPAMATTSKKNIKLQCPSIISRTKPAISGIFQSKTLCRKLPQIDSNRINLLQHWTTP